MCDILTKNQRKSVDDFRIFAEKTLSDENSFMKIMIDAGFLDANGHFDWQSKCENHYPFRECDVYNEE